MKPEEQAQEYKPTVFDRHGPDAGNLLRAGAYGLMIFGLSFPMFGLVAEKLDLHGVVMAAFVLTLSIGSGALGAFGGVWIGSAAGGTWKRFAVDGVSTPYKEQYSYQQALVMRGELDEALASFEAVIAEQPEEIDARIKAAELYAREKGNHRRAAELFREIRGLRTVTPGEDIYATNRLVDLFTGPLDEPGRALVELRRLIDRYPNAPAIRHAREALAALKARVHQPD